MKNMFLLLTLGMLSSFAAETYAQKTMLNISADNVTLEQVLRQIENHSEFLFVYNLDEIDRNMKVNLHKQNCNIREIMDALVAGKDLTYAIRDRHVVLMKISELLQQGISVSGTVADAAGAPMPGVNVVVKGTTTGVVTGADGRFSINVSDEEAVLEFSFVGYATQEIVVGEQRSIDVTLNEEATALDEVVVVGYGTQRKSDVTGSISVTTGEQLRAAPAFGALQGLKGKAAGVNVFINTANPAGISETGPRVIIRGVNSINSGTDPLYVVDGVQMNEFFYLNPNNIERMEVLKDASATAIYGARGANGVILVTTKRGKTGREGTTVSYDGWIKLSTIAKKVDLLNSEEFMQVEEIGFANIEKYVPVNGHPENIGKKPVRDNPLLFDASGNPLYDTDWQDEATRLSLSHNHQLSIQQQNKKSSMGAFFNYSDEEGILLNNYAKRVNTRFVYDSNPTDWLTVNTNFEFNHTWMNGIDDTGGGQTVRRTMWEMPPIFPVHYPSGEWANSQNAGTIGAGIGHDLNYGLEAMTNPVHELTTRMRNRFRTKAFGNLAFVFHLADGLDLRTQIGVDANFRSNKDFSPNDLINISSPNGSAGIYNGTWWYWQEETYLSYNKVINGIHRINGTLGLSWSRNTETSANTGSVSGFKSNFFEYNNLGAGTSPSAPSSDWTQWSMNSYFGRISYSLKDKYLLTATVRADGSSRFGANKRYGFFPSAGLGWVVSNEDFMSGTKSWMSYLKLHTSYGRTGNSEIGSYSTLATISSSTYLLNSVRVPYSYMSRMPNPDLEWEKTDQFDIGMNLGLLNNRINLEVDYYYKKTFDLLLSRPLPFTSGFSSVTDNIGRVDNQGIDFLLTARIIDNKKFSWESTLNLNYNKNEIKKLGENDEDILTDPGFLGGNIILRVGEPLASFWGYERLGTWSTSEAAEALKVNAVPGVAKRSKDKQIIGHGLPDFTGSFLNHFYYGNWDLNVELQFVLGVDAWQLYKHSAEDRVGIANTLATTLHKAWTPENQNTMVQQIRQQNYSGQDSQSDSYWVCDGSYLRGSLIQIGYTFDNRLLSKWKMSRLRLSLSVSNAFLIHSKDFLGYDPEGASNTNRFGQNIFFYEYPRARSFSLGLNLSF